MSTQTLGPLPPPANALSQTSGNLKADGRSMSSSPERKNWKPRGAKDIMRFTTQYQWHAKKQERERRLAFKTQAQRSLAKLPSKDSTGAHTGLISEALYDPASRTRYMCPGSFEEDPELQPMVARINDLKRMLGVTEGYSSRPEWEVSRTSPPEVQNWISQTLASLPKAPEPEAKAPEPKPRPRKGGRGRRRSSAAGLMAQITHVTDSDKVGLLQLEGSGVRGEEWGFLSEAAQYLERLKSGLLLSEEHVQAINRCFDRLKNPESKLLAKELVPDALEVLGVHNPDRQAVAKITDEVAPYSQVDLNDLKDILEKWLDKERQEMDAIFRSMDQDANGKVSVRELCQYLGAVGIVPVRTRVKEVVDLIDINKSGTLEIDEVAYLILLYRQTEGFSLKEVQAIRGICGREAQGRKGLPCFKLKDVLLLFFGLHGREITDLLCKQVMEAHPDPQHLMPLSEVLLWARRRRDAEFKLFQQQYEKFDTNRSGLIEFAELTKLVGQLGFTVSQAAVQELLNESEDTLFGVGRKDGKLDFDEFVNFMLKLRTREGFSYAQVKEFKEVFDKFDDNGNAEVEVLELADMLRHLGHIVKLDELQVLISQVDFNGSGALEFQEFLRLMRIHREDEVNTLYKVYKEFEEESIQAMPKSELSAAMKALGYSGDAMNLSKMRAKASGRRRSLQADAIRGLEDSGDAISFEMFLQWVDDHRIVKVREQRRCAGFSSAELDSFRLVFAECDTNHSGNLELKEVGGFLEKLGLPPLATAEERNMLLTDTEKARETAAAVGVMDMGAKGEAVNFWVLVQLIRIQFSRDESKVLERETRAIQQTMFSQSEVDSFRESFVSWFHQQDLRTSAVYPMMDPDACRHKELTKDTLDSLIRSLGVRISEDLRKRLDRKIEELSPSGGLDFADFLRLMRWMVTVDFGGMNKSNQ